MPRDVGANLQGRALQTARTFEEQAKACVAELFKENGGHKCAIDRFGVSLRRAYNFTTLASDEQLSVARAMMLTSAKATAMARAFAHLAGGMFVPVVPAAKAADCLAAIGESAKAHGEALAVAAAALADGKLTPREAADMVKEIDEAVAALAQLRAGAEAMARRQ